MSARRRLLVLASIGLAVVATALGIVYLVGACGSLPSFLGRVSGDPLPRARLGAALLLLAAALAVGGTFGARWRRAE